jgi:glycolate oxidase FAD binding subunit
MIPETLRPESSDQVRDLLAWAAGEEVPIELVGTGTKRGVGPPLQTQYTLDLSGLRGIALYEPEELVLSAGAGTPMAEIEAALTEAGQAFAFEPPDLGPLLGTAAGKGTLAGAVSCNLSGPRRISAGAPRDHFLGFHAVSGRGEAFKSGGRVVKNVTGYDLCKVMAGAYGTLSVMTDLTMKVLPAAEATRTVAFPGLDADAGVRALTDGLHTAYDVSGAAYMPADVAGRTGVAEVGGGAPGVALLRLEGPPKSVVYRADKLAGELKRHGAAEILDDAPSRALWQAVRDVAPFVGDTERAVWRLSVPPSEGARVATALTQAIPEARWYMDWGGGLLWVAVPEGADARHETVRAALPADGSHATLVRAAAEVRARVPVFQPQAPGVAALSRKLKEGFDPRRVLNPGRMGPGL